MVLDFEEYGDAIGSAWTVLREHANRAGLDAVVPTCPGWSVRDLVAHQGRVHRWAAAAVRGQRVDGEAIEQEGRAAVDVLDWLDLGARDLLQALVDAPEDLDVRFFLADPPPARVAWARRQAHETTIHAVDAMAASYGETPPVGDTWIKSRLAVDGIDELVTGFLPSPRLRLHMADARVVGVEATDTGHAWTLRFGSETATASRERPEVADVRLEGPAVELYLALWNRGPAPRSETSDPSGWQEWRAQVQI